MRREGSLDKCLFVNGACPVAVFLRFVSLETQVLVEGQLVYCANQDFSFRLRAGGYGKRRVVLTLFPFWESLEREILFARRGSPPLSPHLPYPSETFLFQVCSVSVHACTELRWQYIPWSLTKPVETRRGWCFARAVQRLFLLLLVGSLNLPINTSIFLSTVFVRSR